MQKYGWWMNSSSSSRDSLCMKYETQENWCSIMANARTNSGHSNCEIKSCDSWWLRHFQLVQEVRSTVNSRHLYMQPVISSRLFEFLHGTWLVDSLFPNFPRIPVSSISAVANSHRNNFKAFDSLPFHLRHYCSVGSCDCAYVRCVVWCFRYLILVYAFTRLWWFFTKLDFERWQKEHQSKD